MKTTRTPAVILGILYLGFIGYLVLSAWRLPAHVASHFSGSGRPNGWMDTISYLQFIAIVGMGFPLVVPLICYCSRFLPDRFQNIPNRDYWLAPERRAETMEYQFRHSLWFASLALCFMTGVHALVIHANSLERAHLAPAMINGLAGGFLVGAVIWAVSMFRHFRHVV